MRRPRGRALHPTSHQRSPHLPIATRHILTSNPFRLGAQNAECTAPRCNRRPLMINVNKLFPRLSIRVKLAIAFALVALGPLAVVSFIGARETVFQIEAMARNTLEHDLEMAETETALSLSSAEGHMNLIAKVVLGPLLHDGAIPARERLDAERVVQTLLATCLLYTSTLPTNRE